jgi:uncharacterized protein YwgA
MDYSFILYKHGPYSFDLSDEIVSLIADKYLEAYSVVPRGSTFVLTKEGKNLVNKNSNAIKPFLEGIDFVSKKVGKRNVNDLECISTALYVTKDLKSHDIEKRAKRLNELKPHIPFEKAEESIVITDSILEEVKGFSILV